MGERMRVRVVTFLGLGRPEAPHYAACRYEVDGQVSSRSPRHDVATLEAYADAEVSLVVLGTDAVERRWFGESGLYRAKLAEALGEEAVVGIGLHRLSDGRTPQEHEENMRVVLRCLDPAPLRLDAPGELEPREEAGTPELVVLDITHGFRSQPFFAAAAVTFGRSQARREGRELPLRILYAAFEAREGDVAPVWDLTGWLDASDWNAALEGLMRYGRADDVRVLLREQQAALMRSRVGGAAVPQLGKLSGVVQGFADALVTMRVPELLTSGGASLEEALREADEDIRRHAPLLAPQVERLRRWAAALSVERVVSRAGVEAMARLARVYLELERYVEVYGTLREAVVTAWTLTRVPEAQLAQPTAPEFVEQRREVERSLNAAAYRGDPGLAELFRALGNLRNDVLHGGMRPSAVPARRLRAKAERFVARYEEELEALTEARGAPADHQGPFVNCSNHPVAGWSEAQRAGAVALCGGALVDVPFPHVPPEADTEKIEELADELAATIQARRPTAVHVAGELSLTLAVVRRLQRAGVTCCCAATARDVTEERQPNGSTRKVSRFRFVRWRDYPAG